MGEGMRIHISSISKELLDMVPFTLILITHSNLTYVIFCHKVGGFRCDYRGALDLGVTSCTKFLSTCNCHYLPVMIICNNNLLPPKANRGQMETYWLIGPSSGTGSI